MPALPARFAPYRWACRLLIAAVLLVSASSLAVAQADPYQGYDPSQPLPLQTIDPTALGQPGQTLSTAPPVMPNAPGRPKNWRGGTPPKIDDGKGGESLADPEYYGNDAERQLAERYRQQSQRSVQGGPPSRATSIYTPELMSILRSSYSFDHIGAEKQPVVTTTRPATAPGLPATASVQPVGYNEPLPQGQVAPGSPPAAYAAPAAPVYQPPPAAPVAQAPMQSAGPPARANTYIESTPVDNSVGPMGQALVMGPQEDLNDPTTVLARVDQQVILVGDVNMAVNEILIKNADKIPKEQLEQARRMLIMQQLFPLVQFKLLAADARHTLPKEAIPKIEEGMGKEWEKSEYQRLLKQMKAQTRAQLDAEFRRFGTSLEREKKQWIELAIASQWRYQHIKHDEEVTHEQMLERYRQTIAKYQYPAAVRWEEIKVVVPSPERRPEKWREIAEAGNLVFRGVAFAEVAKRVSTGSTAAEGGFRDWTTKGSLASAKLDEAIFTLPVGQLSPIIEDDSSLYIIRVVERREAGVTPFTETQAEIAKDIKEEREQKQAEEFLAKIKKNYQAWTIFDTERAIAEREQERARAAQREQRNKNRFIK